MFLRESVKHQSVPANHHSVGKRAAESVNMFFLTPWQPKPAHSLKKPNKDSASFWMVVLTTTLHVWIVESNSTLNIFTSHLQKVVKTIKM